jgi:hypothetical protein
VPRFQNVSQNFTAGVVTPRYSAAVESTLYQRALAQGRNFIISTQGGAVYREGFEYIGNALANQPFRIFTFRRGGDESDILIEVAEGNIRYWEDVEGHPKLIVDLTTLLFDEDSADPDNPDFLIDENDGYFLTLGTIIDSNPYSLDELEGLYFTNQGKYGILCSENHPTFYITSRADGTILTEQLALERIPRFIYNDVNSPRLVSQQAEWRVSFPQSWTQNQFVYYATYNGVVNDKSYSYDPSNAQTQIDGLTEALTEAAARQGYTSVVFTVTSSSITTYDIDVAGADSGWDVVVIPEYGNVFIPIALPPISQPIEAVENDEVREPAWSYPTMVFQPIDSHYYQCTRTHRPSADNEPGGATQTTAELYWIDLGIAIPVGWTYQYPDGNDWSMWKDPPTDTIPNVYAPAGRGFPTVAVFHEQRLILMANTDNPTALYGSGIGDFQSFLPGPNDDQPFLYVLDSSDTPQIKWAQSQNSLVLGTSAGDWAVNANVTITPTDVDAEQQNSSRSIHGQVARIDTSIFYIEQGGRKLRMTSYHDQRKTFSSGSISTLAEQLVSTSGIRRIAGSITPESFIVMTRNNGQPIYLAIDAPAEVVAFSECETDGFVGDVASYFSLYENRDYMFYATERNNRWVLERMRYPCSKLCSNLQAQSVVHLDGWATGIVQGAKISGLAHLEGKEVAILVDDAWQIGTYVVSNGEVPLERDYTGETYAVGLLYLGYLETYEMPEGVNGATGLGTKRRWNRLYTRILNSALPLVYSERASDRRPVVPMGTSDNVYEGLHDIEQNVVGYGDGALVVEQNRPYPLYIVGFFGQYEVNDS